MASAAIENDPPTGDQPVALDGLAHQALLEAMEAFLAGDYLAAALHAGLAKSALALVAVDDSRRTARVAAALPDKEAEPNG